MNWSMSNKGVVKMAGFVYRWNNLVNSRWYLGSHEGELTDGYTGSGKAFRLAVKKHGFENFTREILYVGEDFKRVEDIVLKALALDRLHLSYNIKQSASGGVKGSVKSERMKSRLSSTRKRIFQERGFLNTTEARAKMSDTHKGVSLSSSTRARMSEAQKRVGNRPPSRQGIPMPRAICICGKFIPINGMPRHRGSKNCEGATK